MPGKKRKCHFVDSSLQKINSDWFASIIFDIGWDLPASRDLFKRSVVSQSGRLGSDLNLFT